MAELQLDPPFALPPTVDMRRDIVYATPEHGPLRLDLFLPPTDDGPFPAVVYIHGGGWKNGARAAFWRQAAAMAERGFVGATVEYRLSGTAHYPAALADVAAAVGWVRRHDGEYRINTERLGVAGGSAGGHLAALLGTNRWTVDDELSASPDTRVHAVTAFNPVTDLTAFDPESHAGTLAREFVGVDCDRDPELWRRASPVFHASQDAAPFLLLHGTGDELVSHDHSTAMQSALTAAGARVELFSAEGAGHGFFNRPPWFEPTLQRMAQFFEEVLAGELTR